MLRFFKIWFAVLTGSNLEFSTLKLIGHSNLIAQLACSVFFLTCSSSLFFFSWRNIKMTFITAHIWFRIGPRVSLFSFSDGLKWQCSLLLCHGTYKRDRDSYFKKKFYITVFVRVCLGKGTWVKARGPLMGVSSLLLLYGSLGSNSGCH